MIAYYTIGDRILAALSCCYVRRAGYALSYSFPTHSSDQPLGGKRLIALPGFLLDTIFIEADSHMKNSRNINPFNFSGDRTDICFNTSISAPSTPIAKNAKDLAASPSLTFMAAFIHSSVGAPSVMTMIHG